MKKMTKFFFDDVRNPPSPDWVLARDVPEAKFILAHQGPFDVMSLDHDIGMQMMCAKCYDEIPKPITSKDVEDALAEKLYTGCDHSEHGTQLAKWMVTQLISWPKLIIIHSANPWGAERMRGLLEEFTNVIVTPFHQCRYDTLMETP